MNKDFFVPTGEHLFVVIWGNDPGIFLFGIKDGHWRLLSELQSIPNQGITNRRLNHIFLADHPRHNAGSLSYEGKDISHMFSKENEDGF